MRVIAGSARGYPLRAPRDTAMRPTGDLIKGVVFSMLEAEAYKRGFEPDEEGRMASGLAWPRVLDLYAGTGSLGIEALSRGAREAVFVEQERHALQAMQANVRGTGFERQARVLARPVGGGGSSLEGPFDLVLADPPYEDEGAIAAIAGVVSRAGMVGESSVLVLEQSARATPPEALGQLALRRTRTHGRTRVTLYSMVPADQVGQR